MYVAFRFVRSYDCPSVRLSRPSAICALMHAYATLIAERRTARVHVFFFFVFLRPDIIAPSHPTLTT